MWATIISDFNWRQGFVWDHLFKSLFPFIFKFLNSSVKTFYPLISIFQMLKFIKTWKLTKYSKDTIHLGRRGRIIRSTWSPGSRSLKSFLSSPFPMLHKEQPRFIPAGEEVVIVDFASGPSPTSFTAATENLFQKQFGEMYFIWHGANMRQK